MIYDYYIIRREDEKMKDKQLTAGELMKALKDVDPNTVIATSDYFGTNHILYKPSITYVNKGDSFVDIFNDTSDVDKGGEFVDKRNKFIKNTLYIGHKQ